MKSKLTVEFVVLLALFVLSATESGSTHEIPRPFFDDGNELELNIAMVCAARWSAEAPAVSELVTNPGWWFPDDSEVIERLCIASQNAWWRRLENLRVTHTHDEYTEVEFDVAWGACILDNPFEWVIGVDIGVYTRCVYRILTDSER